MNTPVDAHLSQDHRHLLVAASLGSKLGLRPIGPLAALELDDASCAPVIEREVDNTRYFIANRRIPLDGATNFRDAGGRRTENGDLVEWRTHYRSENLVKLTSRDWELVEALGIDMILDLRHDDESGLAPSKAPSSISIVQIPIVGNLAGHVDATSALLDGKIDRIDDDAMRSMYLDLVAQHGQDLLTAFELYRDHDHPVLVHCTAGKDRTGIVVALWQLSQGVSPREVLEDYRLSSLYRTLPRFLTLRPDLLAAHVNPRNIHSYISTQNESLAAALEALDLNSVLRR
ncbi:tyrosine-protein phosphatase [Ferrimicrobium acidiphilum]|uniref:tyrosine-protein phosphatase n=1 Tax=Ferrimicrobium acidiphilum TaxID=121039 RepID=UPI0023F40408|nr:tyrosine-protein phosphatase [Ferrimicrobium acidiphilum]